MSAGKFALALFVVAALLGLTVYLLPRDPIMGCDPATDLKKEMTMTQVRELCGEPRRATPDKRDWYPLRGDTREQRRTAREDMWVYGRLSSDDHNVNLYFRNGALDSVQIFGEGR